MIAEFWRGLINYQRRMILEENSFPSSNGLYEFKKGKTWEPVPIERMNSYLDKREDKTV